MPQENHTTNGSKYTHLSFEERVIIQTLKNQGNSNRNIAKILRRAPQTINKEINRASKTYVKRSNTKGAKYHAYPCRLYSARRAQKMYEANRLNSGAPRKWQVIGQFLDYVDEKILVDHWSPDVIIAHAKKYGGFPEWMIPCTKSLYNWIDLGILKAKNIDLNKRVRRPLKHEIISKKNRRILGNSIETRPDIVDSREEIGHWEIDTVIGKQDKEEPCLLTLTERKTRFEFIIKIEGKTRSAVSTALDKIIESAGIHFSDIFKSITADNGSEFCGLHDQLKDKLEVYFTHPYSSFERGTNENHNAMIRRFIPKRKTISDFSERTILRIQTWMNDLPRKILDYDTPKMRLLKEMELLNLSFS
jgi:IS30 family transposase